MIFLTSVKAAFFLMPRCEGRTEGGTRGVRVWGLAPMSLHETLPGCDMTAFQVLGGQLPTNDDDNMDQHQSASATAVVNYRPRRRLFLQQEWRSWT